MGNRNIYDKDFTAWADEQALLLEQQRWNELDLAHLVEAVDGQVFHQRDRARPKMIYSHNFYQYPCSKPSPSI